MLAKLHQDQDGGDFGTLVITVGSYESCGTPGGCEIRIPVRDVGVGFGQYGMGLVDLPLPSGVNVSVTDDVGRLVVSGPDCYGDLQFQAWGRWYVRDCPGARDGSEAGEDLAAAVQFVIDAGRR
jgi:hypothetical protein